VALAQAGIPFVVLDNLCNSRRSVLERVERITGAPVSFIEGDIRDTALLQRVFAEHAVEGVIHFAALKSVGESVREPLRYYDNNVAGTVALLGAMRAANVRTLVFSSSATVYGDPASVLHHELAPAVGVGGRQREVLTDRHRGRVTIHRGRRGKHQGAHPGTPHGLQERHRARHGQQRAGEVAPARQILAELPRERRRQ
jgi:nucleoside-diphosphate-sugar epimerase